MPASSTDPLSLQEFHASLVTRHPLTQRAYLGTLRDFLAWLAQPGGNPFHIESLTQTAVQGYLDALKSRGAAPRTRSRAIAALRRFGQWAVDEGYLRRNPARQLERPTVVALAPTELSGKQRFVLKSLVERAFAADDAGQSIDLEALIDPETLEQFPVSEAELRRGKRSQEWREVLRQMWEEGIQSGPGHFANAEELLAEAKRRYLAAGEQHLEELLVEGLNTRAGILVDDPYWDKLQRDLEAEDHEAHNSI